MGDENEMGIVHLADLFEPEVLQRIQDAFAALTGIALLTTDENGIPVTKGSNFTEFCKKCRATPIGAFRCEQCSVDGAQMALEKGNSVSYVCHAGMVEFAAPILVSGKMVGCYVGGQVRTRVPDIASVFQMAREIGVDAIGYLQSALDVPYMAQEDVDKAANALYTIADVISSITYHKYLMHQANIEIERAAHMKSDFLANMSHEIRTPMNAVIGMAEMALREEMSADARDYINQIKSSGKTLLTIINDILDFSKIEAGKMKLNPIEYEPMSIINDIDNMIMTRIGEKDVELIIDVAPTLPYKLIGDAVRIKQIITNICNNAVKFTEVGEVRLSIDYEQTSDDELRLLMSVKDTGIGIRDEDLGRLFESFEQIDSKRNRNIEGTGLGLAISKQFLLLMGGDIEVKSEYGAGSTFSFYIPQRIAAAAPSVTLREESRGVVAAVRASNTYLNLQLNRDITRLGAVCVNAASDKELKELPARGVRFLFVDSCDFTRSVQNFIRRHPDITVVLMTAYNERLRFEADNLMVVKKPLYSLNLSMILNHEDLHNTFAPQEADYFNYIAPSAQVLLVDDNAINLTVAKGLLEPLKLQIDCASGGREAIDMVGRKQYDLILMDHMMPEIDGIEATHIIRRFYESYKDTPIIALTANAVEGTRELFLKEGMDDYVPKPIEIRELVLKLAKWLPPDKIEKRKPSSRRAAHKKKKTPDIKIEGLDTRRALGLLGSKKLYLAVLKDYYNAIPRKEKQIRELAGRRDWKNYTVEVHALKSASRQIGAMELGDMAEAMEKAGKAYDVEVILKNTEPMLASYHRYIELLAPLFPEEKDESGEDKPMITPAILNDCFAQLQRALDDLDMDEMEQVVRKLDGYAYPGGRQQDCYERLKVAVDNLDVESCAAIMQEWQDIVLGG